ncbi:MAG: DUF4238 domain-containing protein [Daejeonella sp.]|uniref:DUF4238 domain-containing protein n=1 Tax=Daejeonella sp. TaxID=2805397 RepID=UPI003C78A0BD
MGPPYIQTKYSKRHHFLPIFYLKGFTDNQRIFYVYDKIENKFLDKQIPASKYFEKDLNNYKVNGKIHFTLEESFFTPIDTDAAPLFADLQNMDYDADNFTYLDKFRILHFLMFLYWRSPNSKSKFLDLIDKEGFSNRYFGFHKDGVLLKDKEIPDIKISAMKDDQFQKLYKLMTPLSNGALNELYNIVDNWNLYSLHDPGTLVVGDNPFVINNPNPNLDSTFGELIFPLSRSRLLILSKSVPAFLDSTLTNFINLSILDSSNRFISCDNKEALTQLVDRYLALKINSSHYDIKHATFETMHIQAKFKSFEHYCEHLKNRHL